MLESKDLKSIKSTQSFWLSNKNVFPHLRSVALILLNIASNSAFVEKFFCLSGLISHNKTGNMSDSLLIKCSMLNSNLKLIK